MMGVLVQIAERFPNLYDEPDARHVKAGIKDLIEPYGWFNTFITLAGGDVLRIKEAAKLPLYTAYAFLSLQAAKNEFEQNLMKEK